MLEIKHINRIFHIRDYSYGDYDLFIDFWKSTGLGDEKRGDNEQVIMRTIENGGFFLVLLDDEKQIIGTSWVTNDFRRLYLHHFGIRPEYQGKGLANILMDYTLKRCVEIGYQLKLEVHKHNVRAANLYRKYGFTYLGDYHVYIIRKYE